jgi:hypothetical protein
MSSPQHPAWLLFSRIRMTDHSSCAVRGVNCLLTLKHWGHDFDSHSKHECLCVFVLCLSYPV